jgi:hypothetical protein
MCLLKLMIYFKTYSRLQKLTQQPIASVL